ncbi:MAG: hypothetical protein ACKO6C_07630 [Alphaproteobacteria bacterium]
MKLKILFNIFLFLNLGIHNASAQNNASPAPAKQATAPKLPVSNAARPPEQIEYEKAFKSLSSAQKSKFDQINRDFFKNMMDAVNILNNEAERIGKINQPLAIINRIFPALTQQNSNSTPYDENTNKIYQKYLKLSSNEQKLLKIEVIKFRKAANKNEIARKAKMKEIFKKDFLVFTTTESIAKIEADEKTIPSN